MKSVGSAIRREQVRTRVTGSTIIQTRATCLECDGSRPQMRPDEQTESVGSFRAERLISPPPLRAAASMIGARCTDVIASGMTTRPPPWLATEGDDGRFDFYVANVERPPAKLIAAIIAAAISK